MSEEKLINRISTFTGTLLCDEPLDGDATEHLANIFRFFLDSMNGNLSKAEESRLRMSLGIHKNMEETHG
jgi:hypothetical protein